jgi:hypothetical protein
MKPFTNAEQTLLRAGYGVACLLLLIPVADTLNATWPPMPRAVQWRFGVFALIGNSISYPVLAMLLVALIARALENRVLLRVLSGLGVAVAVALLGSLLLFAGDTVQLRANVKPEMKHAFTWAAIKSGAFYLLSAAIFLWLGLGAYRSAKSLRAPAKGREKAEVLVGVKGGGATAPVGPPA